MKVGHSLHYTGRYLSFQSYPGSMSDDIHRQVSSSTWVKACFALEEILQVKGVYLVVTFTSDLLAKKLMRSCSGKKRSEVRVLRVIFVMFVNILLGRGSVEYS
jgi:Fe-S cluster biosynthesis and repair protein YggX